MSKPKETGNTTQHGFVGLPAEPEKEKDMELAPNDKKEGEN